MPNIRHTTRCACAAHGKRCNGMPQGVLVLLTAGGVMAHHKVCLCCSQQEV